MRFRGTMIVLLLAALASPSFAGLTGTKKVEAFEAALADAQKALEAAPPDPAQARFCLLAVCSCAFGDGAWENEIPDKDRQQYTALLTKLWPDEKIDEKNRDQALKPLDALVVKYAAPTNPEEREEAEGPIIVYPNVILQEVNLEGGQSLSKLAEWLTEAARQYPEAKKRAVEFAGQAPSPKWFDYYTWHGDKSAEARTVRDALLNVYLGPGIVAKHSKEELLPWSLKNVREELKMWGQSDNPDLLLYKAGEMRRNLDLAFWVDKDNEKAKSLDPQVKALVEKANKIRAAELKAARVPTQRYRGSDAEALKKAFAEVFEQDNPTRKVVRVSIYGEDWVERCIVTSALNNLQAGIYRLLDAAVVAKQGNKYFVHPITFAKQWTGTGNKFGSPKVHSWCDHYEILAENAK